MQPADCDRFVGLYWQEKMHFRSFLTVLGHMEKVDEVAIVHDGDFFLVHFLRLL